MSYVILQQGLEAPSAEQLQKAFKAVPGLIPYDAFNTNRDFFGVLARGLDFASASALKASLASQGFTAEALDESSLPPMPEPRMLHRLDCTDAALLIYDPLDRVVQLGWENIVLVAAGLISVSEFKDVQTNRYIQVTVGLSGTCSVPVTDHDIKEQQSDCWMLDIVIAGGALRYSINASKCLPTIFNYLGVRRTRDVATNFKLLVRDILQHTPDAATNRGAESLREDGRPPFHYASKTAFYDEMIWILWKMNCTSGE